MDLRELPSRSFQRHPWEMVRADFFARLLRESLRGHALAALDLGAGDGYFAECLVKSLPTIERMTCFDIGYPTSWLEANRTRHPRLAFTAQRPDGAHDLIVLLDVLEHVDDSRATLADAVQSLLKPGGLALISVPAWQALFSSHDHLLGHKQRFAPAELRGLVQEAGLVVVEHGQLFSSLLAPRALMKARESLGKRPSSHAPATAAIETSLGSWHHGALVTTLVTRLLSLDAAGGRLAARLGLPTAGLSTWVLARRP
jgi:SAM-dependent methyltransferase